jgi:hypothetical protein
MALIGLYLWNSTPSNIYVPIRRSFIPGSHAGMRSIHAKAAFDLLRNVNSYVDVANRTLL